MDIATVVGVVLAQILILGSIMMGAGLAAFIDIPSIVIVFGGTTAAAMIAFPMDTFAATGKVIKKTFMYVLASLPDQIELIAEFAALARREGLLALEEKLETVEDPFLVKGLRLVVDGFPPEVVRDILGTDLYAMQERHGVGKCVLDKMGEIAPAMGMLGTLIGLVTMLKNLSDPSQIGAGMAVALLTTFYGAYLSNVLLLPMANKLDQRKKEETLIRSTMIEGIVAIQNGDKPAMVKEKLKAFLPPSVREAMDEKAKE